jgi:predicted ATPase
LEPGLSPADSLLSGDRSTVSLRRGAFITDVVEWDAALGEAAHASARSGPIAPLSRAIELYRGELLSGYYEDWILTERERRAEEHLRVLRELATALEQTGDLERAIQVARRAVGADPLCEESHWALMRLYAAAGQPSATWRQYQELERVLCEELGETPAAAARGTAEALCEQARVVAAARIGRPPAPSPSPAVLSLAGAPRSRPSPVTTVLGLPPQLTRFFGRQTEIVRVMETLCRPETHLLTLTGPGGSGKTRLAIAIAEGLAGAGPRVTPFEAVLFVPLADLLAADRLGSVIAESLSVPETNAPAPLDRAVAGLQGKSWLLILDNFEHLAAEGALLVRQLLERVPTLTCLVTSRERLELGIEREFPVPPLPAPEAIPLFVDRAQAVRPEFQLTEANREAVAELCEQLDGLPLALELAAARSTLFSPAQLLAYLSPVPGGEKGVPGAQCPVPGWDKDGSHLYRAGHRAPSAGHWSEATKRFELLATRQRDVLPRHQSLFAAIAGSYELLSPELQRFFAWLSVFRGGWTYEAAEAVCDQPRALDCLEELRACSLLVAEAGEERLDPAKVDRGVSDEQSFLPPRPWPGARQPPRLRAGSRPADPGFPRRHWSEAWDREPARPGPQRGGDEGGGAALWPRSGQRAGRGTTVVPGPGRAGDEACRDGRRGPGEEGIRYRLLETLRQFAWERLREAGEIEAARTRHRDWYLALAERAQAENEGPSHGAWLDRLESEHDNLRAALAWCLEGSGGVEAALRLGAALEWFWVRRGYLAEGRRWLEEAVARGAEVSAPVRAGALASLSYVVICQMDPAGEALAREARTLYEEHLGTCRQEGDAGRLARLLRLLGGLSGNHGDRDAALAYYEESAVLFRQVGDRQRLASVLQQIAALAAGRGDRGTQRALLEECLQILRALDDRVGPIHLLGALGHIARGEGEYERAQAFYLESLALRRDVGDRGAVAQSLEDLACLASLQGEARRATRLLGAGEAYCRVLGMQPPIAVPQEYDRAVATCRAALGEEAFAAAWAEGRSMTLEQTLEYALAEAHLERIAAVKPMARRPDREER